MQIFCIINFREFIVKTVQHCFSKTWPDKSQLAIRQRLDSRVIVIFDIRPRPHYNVFKRKRYCFVPFSKRFSCTLNIVSVSFPPVHTTTRILLKTLLNLIFSYILHPFFLHYFPCDKLKLPHYAEVRPDLVQNYVGFGGFRPSRFILAPPKAGKRGSLIKSCSLLEKSKSSLNRVKCVSKSVKRLKITAINKDVCPQPWSLTTGGLQSGRVVGLTSSFSDSIIFAVHTREKAFSNSIFFKSFHSIERFRIDPFSLMVFGVVVWTVAVSGTKQYRFRLKTV